MHNVHDCMVIHVLCMYMYSILQHVTCKIMAIYVYVCVLSHLGWEYTALNLLYIFLLSCSVLYCVSVHAHVHACTCKKKKGGRGGGREREREQLSPE